MPDFILAYHGGTDISPEECGKHMDDWRAWSASIGKAFVNPGAPVGMSKTVTASGVEDNGGPNPLSGYSILKADDIDSAIEMVKSCPHLKFGTIEVAQMMEMEM